MYYQLNPIFIRIKLVMVPQQISVKNHWVRK